MRRELVAARDLVAGGWSGPAVEPFCVARGSGVRINGDFASSEMEPLWLHSGSFWTLDPHHEGLELYSVSCACLAAGADFNVLERAFSRVEDFQAWLEQPQRTIDEVLRVFTTALLRSRRENRT
jgi:hypothetical protein